MPQSLVACLYILPTSVAVFLRPTAIIDQMDSLSFSLFRLDYDEFQRGTAITCHTWNFAPPPLVQPPSCPSGRGGEGHLAHKQ